VAWLAAQAFAFMLAAAGHGWITPFWASMPLVVLYPLTLVRVSRPHRRTMLVDVGVLAAAAALDVYLVADLIMESSDYFLRVLRSAPTVVAGWIALWLAWQILYAASVIRNSFRAAR